MAIMISLLAGHHYLIHIYHNEKCYNHQGEAPHIERLRTSEFDSIRVNLIELVS